MGTEAGVASVLEGPLADDLLEERAGFVCVGSRKEKKLWDKECLCCTIKLKSSSQSLT